MYVYINMHIYMCVCVCMCVCSKKEDSIENQTVMFPYRNGIIRMNFL